MKNNPGSFASDPQRASEAGRKGGQRSSGNFAHDPKRAAEAGRKGGKASSGNFANNPARAAEAGRKGGLSPNKRGPRRLTRNEGFADGQVVLLLAIVAILLITITHIIKSVDCGEHSLSVSKSPIGGVQ